MSETPMKYRGNPGARLWPRLRNDGPCMVWTGAVNEHGYGTMTIDCRRWKSHRFAYELTHGPIPDGLDVLHSCDNPPCCNPDHLSIGDAKKNAAEMVERGRHGCANGSDHLPHGLEHHSAKMNPDAVRFIRANPFNESVSALGRRFGVARGSIRAARDGITWRTA